MPELELGVFIALNIIAVSGFVVTFKWGFGIMLLLSFVIFAGLSLYMFGGLDVVQSKIIPAQNATATTEQRDENGTLVSSFTKTAALPEATEKVVWLNSDFQNLGMIYFLAAGFSLVWFLKLVTGMFRNRNKVVSSGYWTG